jgi:hypothetical protein
MLNPAGTERPVSGTAGLHEGPDQKVSTPTFLSALLKNRPNCTRRGANIHLMMSCWSLRDGQFGTFSTPSAPKSRSGWEKAGRIYLTNPTVVLVPKGVPHGPVKNQQCHPPNVHYHIGQEAAYKAAPVT